MLEIDTRRFLVAYIAIGSAAQNLCRLSIRAMRAKGWNNDIVVLSDSQFDFGSEVRTAVVPPHHLNLDPVAESWGCEFDCRDFATKSVGDTIKQLTPVLHRYVDLRSYDLVLQMDVDIVPVEDVTEAMTYLNRLPEEFGVSLNKGKRLHKTPASSGNLSAWEKLFYRGRTNLNSGIIFYKPSRTSMHILRDWQAELCQRIRGDQSALQAIYLRKWHKAITVLREDFQEYPPMPHRYEGPDSLASPAARFAHFRGAIKDPIVMLDFMAKFKILEMDAQRET